jgi:hypothetical protein
MYFTRKGTKILGFEGSQTVPSCSSGKFRLKKSKLFGICFQFTCRGKKLSAMFKAFDRNCYINIKRGGLYCCEIIY